MGAHRSWDQRGPYMTIIKAELSDLKEILALQYLAYQSEAALFGNKDILPLKQTLEELTVEYNDGLILKMVSDGKIIGSGTHEELLQQDGFYRAVCELQT